MATTTHRPSADAYVSTFFGAPLVRGNPTDTVGSRYTNIDESSVDAADYIEPAFTSVAGDYTCRFNVSVGEYSNRTIQSVAIKRWAARGAGFSAQSCETILRIGSTSYFADFAVVGAVSPSTENATETWTTNPDTGLAWTIQDVENFRSGGNNSAGARLYTDDTAQTVGLVMIEMTVTWTAVQATKRISLPRRRLYHVPNHHPLGVNV